MVDILARGFEDFKRTFIRFFKSLTPALTVQSESYNFSSSCSCCVDFKSKTWKMINKQGENGRTMVSFLEVSCKNCCALNIFNSIVINENKFFPYLYSPRLVLAFHVRIIPTHLILTCHNYPSYSFKLWFWWYWAQD